LKLNANLSLPKVENLWVSSSQVGPYQNLLASLMQARLTLSALGFVEDLTTPSVEVTSANEVYDENA
jgi:hypothetical protein